MRTGYFRAIELAERKLELLDPAAVCERTGALFSDGWFMIPWMGDLRPLHSGSEVERVLWLHYLTSEGTRPPTGRHISYRDAPGAAFYMPNFEARVVGPLVKRFGNDPSGLVSAGLAIGGRAAELGDASVTVDLLPHMPVTYIIWAGDDELPAAGSALLDETAPGWLCAEDLVVLASQGSYALLRAAR